MSIQTTCPACGDHCDQKEQGNLNHEGRVRKLYRCISCKRVWEEITTRRVVAKTDTVLKMLV